MTLLQTYTVAFISVDHETNTQEENYCTVKAKNIREATKILKQKYYYKLKASASAYTYAFGFDGVWTNRKDKEIYIYW
jgi:hypothetical protein